MDINVLPKKYRRNNGFALACIIRGTEAEKKEKTTALKMQKKPLWVKSFEDYIKTLCIKQWVKVGVWGGIVLGIIGAIAVALAVPFDDMEWYIASVAFSIPMVLGVMACMLLGPRAIYGAVLAFVLSPIIYPIYAAVYDAHNRKVNQYNQGIDAKIALQEDEYDEQIKNCRTAFPRMVAEYEEMFCQEKKAQTEKFAGNPAVLEIAEWLSKRFIKNIAAADRALHIKDVIIPFVVIFSKTDITCQSETYTFEQHRCEDLDSELMQAALAEAVALQIQAYVQERYKKDESGTAYEIQIDFFDNLEEPKENFEDEAAHPDTTELKLYASLTYQAENANYKPAQSW